MSGPIDRLEAFSIAGSRQWALVRGADRDLPVLLVLPAGPGLPLIHEARELERNLGWEKEFRVVYWDLRGCGKSFEALCAEEGLSIAQLVQDALSMAEELIRRFGVSRIFVLGFSLGATIAALAAHAAPQRFHGVIAVSMDIDLAHAEKAAYAFLLEAAEARGGQRIQRQIRRRLGPSPVVDARRFFLRAKWLTEFGGLHTGLHYRALVMQQLKNILSCRHYSWGDVVRALRGMRLVPALLLKDMVSIDLFRQAPRLDTPLFLLQGRHDALAPSEVAERYVGALRVSGEAQILWFHHSAHMPHYEEPRLFAALLQTIKRHVSEKNLSV